MNSFFAPAPFERFNLSRQAMGQSCPIGELAMRLPNGQIVCSKASLPSGMFVPSAGHDGNVAYGMGQAGLPAPYLTQIERDQILAQITDAKGKAKPVEAMIAWSTSNDPGLNRYFGMDASRFNTMLGIVAPLYPTVSDLADRLAQTDAEYWYRPSDDEMAQVKQWILGVNELYKIMAAHPTPAAPLPPGTQPAPNLATALAKNGALTSSGLQMNEILIGVGLLAAAGALAYAVLKT
jgi:hypothetical protein